MWRIVINTQGPKGRALRWSLDTARCGLHFVTNLTANLSSTSTQRPITQSSIIMGMINQADTSLYNQVTLKSCQGGLGHLLGVCAKYQPCQSVSFRLISWTDVAHWPSSAVIHCCGLVCDYFWKYMKGNLQCWNEAIKEENVLVQSQHITVENAQVEMWKQNMPNGKTSYSQKVPSIAFLHPCEEVFLGIRLRNISQNCNNY